MTKKWMTIFSLLMIAAFVLASCAPAATPEPTQPPAAPATQPPAAQPTTPPEPTTPPPTAVPEPVKLALWTKEGEADGGLQWVKSLTDAYTKLHPEVTFDVVNKDVETLREDFQTSSLAGNPPDLLWTVSDHAGPFTTADLIQPVDGLVDLSKFVESAVTAVQLNGKTWGVPISNGNQLMLLYNKDLVPTPPKDTDEMISMAKAITKGGVYGLVYNQTEPFWLVPWLGGFGGVVFASDGVTPTLDTPEMVATLKFLQDIKYTDKIVPPESDYNGADTMFKEGKAGMIVNGDWSVADYQKTLGDKLGVVPLPKVTATGKYPAPYTSGVFFMIPKDLSGAKLDAVKGFMNYVTSEEVQLDMVKTLKRLPALSTALQNDLITKDPLLSGAALQMTYGTPMPTVVEMRCNWDSMKPEMQSVLANKETPEAAAKAMQTSAEACIKKLQ
jgi:arabinogalactan oligomer/maltooligosaccharide transport system substrate-binding protein